MVAALHDSHAGVDDRIAERRAADPDFARIFRVGDGLALRDAADEVASVADASLDFVEAGPLALSEVRPHLADWLRVVKPGGHLIVLLADEAPLWPAVIDLMRGQAAVAAPVRLTASDDAVELVLRRRGEAETALGGPPIRPGRLSAEQIHRLTGLAVRDDWQADRLPLAAGEALLGAGDNDGAAGIAQRLLAGQADHAAARALLARAGEPPPGGSDIARARAAFKRGDIDAAERLTEAALDARPEGAALHLAGLLAIRRGDEAAAADYWQRASAADPPYPEALLNYGRLLVNRRQYSAALAPLTQALRHPPFVAPARAVLCDALARLAATERHQGAAPDAVSARVRQALALDDRHAKSRFVLAEELLRAGDLANGFRAYEWRWQVPGFPLIDPMPDLPAWQGEDPAGRRLVITPEQGLGDAIQFCRYAPLLADRGARVFLCVPPPLVGLMGTLDGVERVDARYRALRPADLKVSMMSLPRLFGTTLDTIPCPVGYLSPPPERVDRWRDRLADDGRFTIAFAWRGRKEHPNDTRRSLPIDRLRPLFEMPETRWLGLAVGDAPDEISRLGLPHVVDLAPEIDDFADTAAVLAQVDLVVTVDTALAHLAGAMNVPTLLLLAIPTDWRWLTDRADSPWYPSLQLIRQQRPGDWSEVLAAAAEALDRRVRRRG